MWIDWHEVRTKAIAGLFVTAVAGIAGWLLKPFMERDPETLWAQASLFLSAPIGLSRGAVVLLLIAGLWIVFALLRARSPDLEDSESIGIEVISPGEKDQVGVPFTVTGTCKALPKGYWLWLFTIFSGGSGARYWPQPCELRKGKWTATIKAKNWQPGDTRTFAPFLVGPAGQALIRHYFVAGESMAPGGNPSWPGIVELTPDMKQFGYSRTVFLR
jgi:hypothetical protein